MNDPAARAGHVSRAAAKFRNIVKAQLENAGADLCGMNDIEAGIEAAVKGARRALQPAGRETESRLRPGDSA